MATSQAQLEGKVELTHAEAISVVEIPHATHVRIVRVHFPEYYEFARSGVSVQFRWVFCDSVGPTHLRR